MRFYNYMELEWIEFLLQKLMMASAQISILFLTKIQSQLQQNVKKE